MYCKQCGKEIPSDSRFCPYCGTDNADEPIVGNNEASGSVQEETQKTIASVPEKQKNSSRKIFWIVLISIIFIVALAYTVPYLNAKKAAISGNYEKAKSLLVVPAITEIHDKSLLDYINAGLLVENEKYSEAYTEFEKLASVGYEDSKNKLEELKEIIYNKAISLYRNRGDSSASLYLGLYNSSSSNYYNLFKLIPDYKDSGKYILLIKAITTGVTDREFDRIVADLSFEDTKTILLNDGELANKFLLGSWKTDDGKWEFQMKVDTASCNLPKPEIKGDTYYSIDDGLYFIYSKETTGYPSDQQIKDGSCYKIKILDYNTISVFCYADGNTYTMHRQ